MRPQRRVVGNIGLALDHELPIRLLSVIFSTHPLPSFFPPQLAFKSS